MTDHSKINLITQALEQPRYIGTEETEQLKQLLKAHPHFIPARYALAATKNRDVPLTQEALSEIYPYCGNWLQLYGYLNGRGFEARKFSNSPASDVLSEGNDYADEYNQMLSADLEQEEKKEPEPQITMFDDNETPAEERSEEANGTGYVNYQEEDAPVYINYFPEEPKDKPVEASSSPDQSEVTNRDVDVTETPAVFEWNSSTEIAEDNELTQRLAEQTDNITVAQHIDGSNIEEPILTEDLALVADMIEASEADHATETEAAETVAGDNDHTIQETMTAHKHQHAEEMIVPASAEDYFTYQGIRVSNELPADISSLTDHTPEQLEETPAQSLMVMMSFTEWLLHFKSRSDDHKEEQEGRNAIKAMWQREKLAAIMEEEDEEIPEQVFEMAVNSVAKENNLVSEALAEVYVKQSKFDKAIDMYLKLSLRDPSKNAYFAKKIEGILKDKEV